MIKFIVFITFCIIFSSQSILSKQELVSLNNSTNIEFIENRGQYVDSEGNQCSDIKFICFTKGQAVYLRDDGISVVLSKNVNNNEIRKPVTNFFDYNNEQTESKNITFCRSDINFSYCNNRPEIIGVGKVKYYRNYYLAHCPDGITKVPVYNKVRIINIYENIDILFYENNGEIEYDFIVKTGGDPEQIVLKLDGFINKEISDNGSLILENSIGKITKTKPITLQGEKQIESHYILSDKGNINFKTANYDKSKTIIIDPMIRLWGTYIGGGQEDFCSNLKKDDGNNLFVIGATSSNIVLGKIEKINENITDDAFIAKFTMDGDCEWFTIFGGNDNEYTYVLDFDYDSNIYIAGKTTSVASISTSGVYQEKYGGEDNDAFVMKFNSEGQKIWGTYYGGNMADCAQGLVLDHNGNFFISGLTGSSNNISTSGAHQRNYGGGFWDGFIAKFDTTGNIIWGTYYGGSNYDRLYNIVVDSVDNIFSIGYTNSQDNISTNGAPQENLAGDHDCMLVKFNSNGSRLIGTYFGGSNDETGYCISLNSENIIYITGQTNSSSNIATNNAYQTVLNGLDDCYIGKFNSKLERVWCTYFGGEGQDNISLNQYLSEDNNIFITGMTSSATGLATENAYQNTLIGSIDAFAAAFDTTGSLLYSTYFGGEENEFSRGITYYENDLFLAGQTSSMNRISTPDSYREIYAGQKDGFLVRLTLDACDEASFNYDSFKQISNLIFVKDTRLTDSTITLTPADYWKGGAIWHSDKIPVKKGFTTDFSFRFSEGEDSFTEEEYPGADGISFVIQNQSNDVIGTLGGGGGYKKISNSLAVEFDTYYNNDDDSEHEDFNDPNENHIAVFCNGTEANTCDHSSKAHLASTAIMPIVPDGRIYYSRIEYDYKQKELKIYLDTTAEIINPPVLVISDIDLSQMLDLDSEEYAWVGFTSATGNAFERHELLSWNFCSVPTSAILTDVEELELEEISNYNLKIYPNPSTDAVNIEYFIENFASVSLKVFDVFGSEVITLKDGINDQGKLRIKWDTKGFKSGIYYLIVDNGTNILSEKIVLIK